MQGHHDHKGGTTITMSSDKNTSCALWFVGDIVTCTADHHKNDCYKLKTRRQRGILRYKFFYALCIVVLAGCKGEQNRLSTDEVLKVESEVRQLFDHYFEAIRKDGMTAELQYLDRSSDFFWVPPGYHDPISYDSVVAVLTLNAPRFVSVENTFDTLRIIPLTTSLATYTAKLRSVMQDTSGNISSLQFIETGVVIKRSDGWKLLSGQTSLIK